jgi:4-carboxymuconolactone decarboxylase
MNKDVPEFSAQAAAGLPHRRRVLGDAWVDQSLAKRTAFTAPFQELVTQYAWGEIWSRPGLPDKTRRLMVISTTVALGAWEEFELHVRTALEATNDSGITPDELQECLLQAAIYCGVPKANTAFKLAQQLLLASRWSS